MLALIGNIIWFILSGWITFLSFAISGLFWCITIIGIPIGIACFRLAWFALFPFGRELVPAEYTGEGKIAGTGCMNGIWFLFFGIWMAVGLAVSGVIYCLTIVLIPLGLGCFRLAGAALFPLGKRVVSKSEADAIRERIRQQVSSK